MYKIPFDGFAAIEADDEDDAVAKLGKYGILSKELLQKECAVVRIRFDDITEGKIIGTYIKNHS